MTALPPIAGEITGVLTRVETVSIHGDVYYDLVVRTAEGETRLRAPGHACAGAPSEGERVRVRLLMRQVVGVERIA